MSKNKNKFNNIILMIVHFFHKNMDNNVYTINIGLDIAL